MAKNEEIKKYSKVDKEVGKYDFTICPNCGETEVAKFCPNCGQSNKDFNKPIKEILGELFGSINFDIRIINTIIPFFIKPGFLTQEYFKGKRQRYVPPMRLYMFFSIIFFFFAQYAGIKNINKTNFNDSSKDSTNQFMSFQINNIIIADSINANEEFDKEKLREEIMNDSTASEGTKKAILGGMNFYENKELFIAAFMKKLSYVLFILMPVFALILALILWSSRMLYVKHLIFSINFHSFVFGISTLVIILSLILPDQVSGYFLNLLWAIPIYLIVGISRFYNRKMIGAFFKALGAIILYWFIIAIVFLIIFYFTAKEFA